MTNTCGMTTKTYAAQVIQSPNSITEFEFNELKLNSVIMEIEREILELRATKLNKLFEAQKREAEKSRLREVENKLPLSPPARKWWQFWRRSQNKDRM